MTDHIETQELVRKIETKDKRFRTAQAIFMSIVLITLIAVVSVQLRTLQGVQQQLQQQKQLLEQQKRTVDEIQQNNEQQLAKVSNQLDCIAQFFAQRDRASAQITDLQQCTIVHADGSIEQPTFPQPTGSGSTPSPTAGSQPQSTPSQAQPQQPPADNSTTPPREILGVPICIPFTGVCAR
jgi:TolA-binding protein